MWKEAILAYFKLLSIWLEGLDKLTKNLSHNRWIPGQDPNLGLPEYETWMLTTKP